MLTLNRKEEQQNVKVIETLQKHIIKKKDRRYIYMKRKCDPGKGKQKNI